jgi:hypothetical protein
MCMNVRTLRFAALLFVAGCASAQPQSAKPLSTLECRNLGPTVMEPLSDRAGHALQRAEFACASSGAPFDGGEGLGANVWVWDQGRGTAVTGDAIYRRPGAAAVTRMLEASLTPQMKDGRMVGWTSAGRFTVLSAHGAWAAEAGRNYRLVSRSTGFKSFVVDVFAD